MPIKASQWNPANPSSSPYNADASTFNIGMTGNVRFAVWNASPNDILISWGSGNGQQDLIPAWLARLFCVNIGQSQLQWEIDSTLDTSATPPASLVKVFTYQPSENIVDTFPIPIQHQVSLGSGVNVISANNVSNTNLPAGSVIVFGLPVNDTHPTGATLIYNDGEIILGDAAYLGTLSLIENGGDSFLLQANGWTQTDSTGTDVSLMSDTGILLLGNSNHAGQMEVTDGTNTSILNPTSPSQFGGQIAPNAAPTVHNGSVSGTATLYTPVWGNSLKIVMLVFNNYQSGSSFTFTLPGTMSFGNLISGNFGAETVTPQLNGVNSTVSIITALASGGGTLSGTNPVSKGSIGELAGATNQLLISSNAAAVSRMLLIIGV